MKTVKLQIPDNLDEKEMTLLLATQLYDKGKLSLGQAANFVGMNKEEFMDKLGEHGVSIFGESIEDIEKDLKNG